MATESGSEGAGPASGLGALERRLLDECQRGLPLVPAPFAALAERLGSSEQQILRTLAALTARGLVSRVGAVFAPRRIGESVLAALAAPHARIEEVAAIVNEHPEVNHNYEREHAYNLWFVVTAPDGSRVQAVLDDIERRSGLEVLRLPLEHAYHIDLGFPLWR